MFTRQQRYFILKWGGLTLFSLSLLPLLTHGLFFIVLFQYYLPISIIGFALYYSYRAVKGTNVTDSDINTLVQSLY